MTDAFVLGSVRTPVGPYGGSLSHVRVDDLLGRTMVAACERVGVPLDRIEAIIAGCVNPAHDRHGRHRALGGSCRRFPGLGARDHRQPLLRLPLSAAISIAHAIRSDELSVGLAAGVESMSRSGGH
ncbi:MAG TPA: hypothetical protein VKF14_06720 [Candidatus Dormibacteraeota bacterium]|nr:hypothetical protein [Candidatus Dormibacteraeota bacterium]